MSTPIVRAVDVGYGHVKFTQGRAERGDIFCDSFPSQAPEAVKDEIKDRSGIVQNRDTFRIPIGKHVFEVGRELDARMDANAQTEALATDFCLTDGYAARLYGALNYMLPGLAGHRIDYLVLGLPLTTYNKYADQLARKFSGEHLVGRRRQVVDGKEVMENITITIGQCFVFPQPLGAYAAYLGERNGRAKPEVPQALIVDPGYNTVDWLVCRGMTPNPQVSGAVERGMSAMLNEVVTSLLAGPGVEGTEPKASIKRTIDRALAMGTKAKLYGKEIDLAPHLDSCKAVVREAIQAVKNKVGHGHDIDAIVVAGGGASFYADELRASFPKHEVVTLNQASFANVRGFQLLGERIAKSHARATAAAEAA